MRKKIICLSIMAGLFLSIGLGVSKEIAKFNNNTKQNLNSNMFLSEGGQVLPEPKVIVKI